MRRKFLWLTGAMAVAVVGTLTTMTTQAGAIIPPQVKAAAAPTAAAHINSTSSTSAPPAAPSPSGPANARVRIPDAATLRQQASQLPAGVVAAVQHDLHETPEAYLANAAAAVGASDITPALQRAGIDPAHIWVDGSTVKVHTTTAAQANAVSALGAEPTTDPPPAAPAPANRPVQAYTNLVNGTGWGFMTSENTSNGTAQFSVCSIGFNGYVSATDQEFVSAGHCWATANPQPTPPVNADVWSQSTPSENGGTPTAVIGPVQTNTFQYGGGNDAGLVKVTSTSLTPQPTVSEWGAGTLTVRDRISPTVGASVCKSGRTTGWGCGTITGTNVSVTVEAAGTSPTKNVTSFGTDLCAYHGDSGGSVLSGMAAVGIVSSGNWSSASCTDNDGAMYAFALQGQTNNVAQLQPSWEPQVAVDTPTVSADTQAPGSVTLSGTLSNANARNSVYVYIDGATTPTQTYAITSGNSWTVTIPGLSAGSHTYSVAAGWGTYNRSTAATGSFTVTASSPPSTAVCPGQSGSGSSPTPSATATPTQASAHPTVDRISGQSRYETSALLAQQEFPSAAPTTVILTNGDNFPDALATGPLAKKLNAPILLTTAAGNTMPDPVYNLIHQWHLVNVVIIGSIGSVAAGVETQVRNMGITVTRIQGTSRYATARQISQCGWASSTGLYIADGLNYPDALSAVSPAAAAGVPIILIDATAPTEDQATMNEIARLNPSWVKVLGGTVPNSALQQIKQAVPNTVRLNDPSADNRFNTAKTIITNANYTSASRIFVTSGLAFPDALAAGVYASMLSVPLYINLPSCVLSYITSDMNRLGVNRVTLIGGPDKQDQNVANLQQCS